MTPSSSANLLDVRALADPYPLYEALRATGPVIYLEHHEVWAVTGHRAIHTAHRLGTLTRQAVTGPGHDPRPHRDRHRTPHPETGTTTGPGIGPGAGGRARQVLEENTHAGVLDAAACARQFAAGTVMALAGLPAGAAPRLPPGRPAAAALTSALHTTPAPTSGSPLTGTDPGAPGRPTGADQGPPPDVLCALEHLDTTIAGLTETIWQLAHHPIQWAALRAAPARLARAALAEALRREPPLTHEAFTTTMPTRLPGVRIPAGQVVWLLYGAAGRDRNVWGPDADAFNIHRPHPHDPLALRPPGLCPGTELALEQAVSLLGALAGQARALAPAGDPVRIPGPLRTYAFAPVTTRPTFDPDPGPGRGPEAGAGP
ncbi:cytochrome P450 [Streptomyces yaizuensis]|uniref:Cytochrome P450 n=1 Tax=Streptomyces yaizuensis TaxID=2989713 RepID=A0ABQ5P693_9ACTN|nr:cytochrome P450 [Streptomyces sp. YSPA8]GLF98117.1 cytochrome P450 [Streptomyces sp. YSPA8]